MNNFISYCSSYLSCCPPFQKQNSGTFKSDINPARHNHDGMLIECQLVTISIVNSNQRNIEEIAPEKPKLENSYVDQFLKKNEASFTENTLKPSDPPEFLNTTSQQINPRLDHETKNDSPTNILSSPPLEISPPLTHRRVEEIVKIINGDKGANM
jgi:hypothetical protein